MKTYVLTVSRLFPATHKRVGEQTYFMEKITNAIRPGIAFIDEYGYQIVERKIHTIRANFPLWEKRISEIQSGKAILSIRYWSGKPYNSKQVEICQLDKNSGVGVQELDFIALNIERPFIFGKGYASRNHLSEIAKNDCLSLENFKEWFKNYDLSKPMAIIHFTNFRY